MLLLVLKHFNKTTTKEENKCSSRVITLGRKLYVYEKADKRFERSEKFLAGCCALGGKPVKEISEAIGMSREYVYQQKERVSRYVESLDENDPEETPIIRLDKRTIERIILSLTLDCQSPQSGIQCFLETVCGKSISIGYISGIINEAARRAQTFDDQVDLSKIRQGANDEIFQCGVPVLTGIDPESTYTYLLEEAKDRTASTWEIYLADRRERGLDLETSINDGGAGLMAGIPLVFPDAEIQADTFHAAYDLGKEVSKLERKAYKLLNEEYVLERNLGSKRPREKNKEALKEIQPKVSEAVKVYDLISILYVWLKEMLSFSGYSLVETMQLAEWILEEMNELASNNPNLRGECAKVRKILPSLLSFIGRLERGMAVVAQETGISAEALRLMYRQMSYSPDSYENNELLCNQLELLGDRYTEAMGEFERLLKSTKKASSLVENLNGRIRGFIEVKRVIPTRFFVLLKVYYNTRRYKRSRCSERIGKSPLELMTGRDHPEFLEALGY